MSTLDSVCASSDALAELVLRYGAMRRTDPLGAARLRDRQMIPAAVALKANVQLARDRRDEAVRSAQPLKCWTPHGPQPLPPRPDNDNPSSMSDSLA